MNSNISKKWRKTKHWWELKGKLLYIIRNCKRGGYVLRKHYHTASGAISTQLCGTFYTNKLLTAKRIAELLEKDYEK